MQTYECKDYPHLCAGRVTGQYIAAKQPMSQPPSFYQRTKNRTGAIGSSLKNAFRGILPFSKGKGRRTRRKRTRRHRTRRHR